MCLIWMFDQIQKKHVTSWNIVRQCQIRLSHTARVRIKPPERLDGTGGVVGSGAAEVSRAVERAFPHPAAPITAEDCRSAVRLGYVPRSAVRELSCQLHNGVVGLWLSVSLLPPSFLSGGPAQNVGPSVARIPRVSSLAYTRALSLSLSLSYYLFSSRRDLDREDENHLGRGVSETRHDKQDRRAAFVNVTQQPTWEAS